MSIRRLLQQAFVFTLAVLLLAGCGGAPAEQQGEIIGVKAQTSPEEAQSGEINNLTYIGTILVLLPDNEEVIANYTEEFLSDITEAPGFNVDQFTFSIDDIFYKSDLEGYVATITIDLKEHQNVLLVRNDAGEWEVTKVLK